MQTKYMPHVSDEVRTQDECLEMHELVIFTLHFTKRQKLTLLIDAGIDVLVKKVKVK